MCILFSDFWMVIEKQFVCDSGIPISKQKSVGQKVHVPTTYTMTGDYTWSLRPWWSVWADAMTWLQCSRWSWHDGVIAAHWQRVWERKWCTNDLNSFVLLRCFPLHTLSNCTFVVENALHLHGGPGVGNAEHGTGHQTLQGGGTVRGPDKAPVRSVVAALQDLHCLTTPHCQLVAVAGHEVVYDHSQLTATGELKETRISTRNKCRKISLTFLAICVCVCVCHLVAV